MLISTVITVGLPVLALLFYLDGLVVGKVLQPPVMFIAYITVANPQWPTVVGAAVICTGTATLGQWTLYRGFDDDSTALLGIRRRLPYLESVPKRVEGRIGERRLAVLDRQFGRYGGWALCIANIVPGIRGLMTVPAGLSEYPADRFLYASAVGNGLYLLMLLGVSQGVLEVGQFLFAV